jgi:hypothetical protein
VVTKYRFNSYEMHCEGNLSCCLIEVVTKAGLTVT